MISTSAPRGAKLLITIVDQGKGEEVLRLLDAQGDHFHLVCLGEGTARADMLELMGLRAPRKDIVFSTLGAGHAQEALSHLRLFLHLDMPGKGIAFTLPISSVGGMRTLKLLTSQLAEEENHGAE